MTEDSKEVRITYETLYEILRREKSTDELQKLDSSFCTDVISYLRDKTKILADAAGKFDVFSVNERDSTQVQMNNIKRILKELYEKRERKIIDMALNKSRTNSSIIDTANLLDIERPIYNELIKTLDNFRKEILHAMLELRMQEQESKMEQARIDNTADAKQAKVDQAEADASLQSDIQEAVHASIQANTQANTQAATQGEAQTESKPTVKKIKFIQKVEQFIGPELDTCGPFEPEQTQELPAEIADILLEKGSAIEVK